MGSWGLNVAAAGGETFGMSGNRGTLVTANATAHVKGTPVQLTAATAREAYGVYFFAVGGGAASWYLMDLLIGAATAAVLIPNMFMAIANQTTSVHYYFPIRVPAGSRLACQVQSNPGGGNTRVGGILYPADHRMPPPYSRVTDYGAVTGSTTGTVIPGNTTTANTKGTITQITASTTNPMRQAVLGVGPGTDITTAAACEHYLDIRAGASTEAIIIPDVGFMRDSGTDRPNPESTPPLPTGNVPAGTRLTGALSSTVTTAGDRDVTVIVYGID